MKRLPLMIAIFSFGVISAPAQDWAKARVHASPRHLEWVTVKNGDREVKCYIGFPERKDKAPAVLVIHEIFGHTDWVQSMVDELAAAGYIAIAPDLLSGMGPNGGGSSELGEKVGKVINTITDAQLNGDLDAAAAYVSAEPSCNGKLAVAGFCWGGGKTYIYAAHNPKLGAALVFYGPPPKPEVLASIKVPVYGFFGGNDARITAGVPALSEQMKASGKRFEPVVYEGAGHGFMRAGEDPNDKNPANRKAQTEAWDRLKAILSKL